jgi:2-keto-4-pentenoate hydratase/2-oxohepta-3-ene-1,7-dioic acid hydratase in catechol pathway
MTAQYTLCNDVSARKRMFATPQWGMGKCYDGWLPLGPCLVSSSQFQDAQSLKLKTTITPSPQSHQNPLQDGNTSDMLWQMAETVSALSYGTTLKVGDIICTGTPDGQGSGRKPQVWLQDGQTVTVWGEGIGSLTNPVVWEKGSGAKESTVRAKL